jgi:hypothetical protein
MRQFIFLFFVFTGLYACQPSRKVPTALGSPYLAHVGNILPDSTLDDPAFAVCFENYHTQYYSFDPGTAGYTGEKPAIEAYFQERFQYDKSSAKENGYITVRFIVNCKGQTGRFRTKEIGLNYKPKTFRGGISAHLLDLTRNMKGWQPGTYKGGQYDYYQYLTFTIENGKILRITP